ncbi:TonB-dependent receptor [Sanyastnella coralliicola]|uniref:TonB-dependent receptor n=1 Tax=Sanyastnella coralliicola TaxID=3069118 RepID=UPI0027B8FFB6|nr:TonB-dependent receptor [Longitalea sp. SCSIO 12813]
MKNVILTLTLALGALSALAQGTIRGKVTDGVSGDVLFANVVIEGTSKGVMADLDGNFSLEDLDPGTYTLSCSFISYETVKKSDVVVTDGEVTIVNFTLMPATFVIEDAAEVVTKADRSRDTYMENIKKKNPSMMDYISSQQIKKTGDSDAAGALKRVTGVSTVGNYVFVRGLSDRYLKTTLNGAEVPSLDPKRNAVQMDIFPTNLIDNLVVVKTLQADLPADYSGAYINVITKDFPDQFQFRYSGSFGYNTNSTFNDDFLTSTGSDTDWIGFDNGFRDAPSIVTDASEIPQQNFSNYYEALVEAGYENDLTALGITSSSDIGNGADQTSIGDIVNAIEGIESVSYVNNTLLPQVREVKNKELSDMGRAFENTWDPKKQAPFLDITQSLSFGNQGKLFGRPLGYVFGIQYKQQNRGYEAGQTGRYTLTGDENEINNLNTERLLTDNLGRQSTYISALLNLSYKLSPNNKIGLTFMPNVSGVNTARYQDGINPSDEIGLGQEQRSQRYLERQMNIYQLRGEHVLKDKGNIKIDWLGSYTRGVQRTPDLRVFINSYNEVPGGTFYFDAEGNDITDDANALLADGENLEEYYPGFTVQQQEGTTLNYDILDNLYPSPTRYYREMVDNTLDLKLNVEIPFTNATGLKNRVRLGGSYVSKTRDYTEQRYSFISTGLDYNGNPNDYFSQDNFTVVPGGQDGYLFLRDDTDIQNSYDASMDVLGAYGMVDWNITSRLRINAGARLETTDMLLESRILQAEQIQDSLQFNFRGQLDLVDILPSFNMTYLLRQYDLAVTNLRISASQSVARPMFREKAPYSVFDFEVQEQQTGNPELGRTLINNFDLRLEHFPMPGESYSVSLFYKQFDDPIEQVIIATAANTEITWKNVDQAVLFGAEFEVRKSLAFLGERFAPFGVGANVTLVQSETSIDEAELEVIRATDLDHEDTRPMFGQSPYIINGILTYDNDSIGLNMALTYNVQGPKLVLVTTGGTPDIYAQPTPNLDFSVSKSLGDRFSIRFKARNLLNPEYRSTYEFKGEEYVFQSMQWGRTFSFGFSYDI